MSMPVGNQDREQRRRRCLFRATHRGTKEMDWLLGRYAEATLLSAGNIDLALWERIVEFPDPELHDWIMGHAVSGDAAIAGIVAAIRAHHGMTQSGT